jgi:flagellar biosynthesis protein FlhG
MTPLPSAPRTPAVRIVVTSGKGGVGKTSVTVNLAMALRRLGYRVGVLDADFALGNIDVLLGLTPAAHLGAVLDGVKTVADVTVDGPDGLRVIPAGSGVRALAALDDRRFERLIRAVEEAGRDLDFLLFDTATGIGDNVLDVIGLAHYVLVLTSFEPAAVVDAYAIIKLIASVEPTKPIGVVVNAADTDDQGAVVFRQISLAAERFLGRSLNFDGCILHDRAVRDAVMAQTPLAAFDSPAPARDGFRKLAGRMAATRSTPGAGPWPGSSAQPADGGPEAAWH